MTCEVRNKEIDSQCAELLVRPLYILIHSDFWIIMIFLYILGIVIIRLIFSVVYFSEKYLPRKKKSRMVIIKCPGYIFGSYFCGDYSSICLN